MPSNRDRRYDDDDDDDYDRRGRRYDRYDDDDDDDDYRDRRRYARNRRDDYDDRYDTRDEPLLNGRRFGDLGHRFLANFIDRLVESAVFMAFGILVLWLIAVAIPDPRDFPTPRLILVWVFIIGYPLTIGLYEILMNSGPYQGTLGKITFGLQVTDRHGRRISPTLAFGRHLAKLLSSATLIGILMIVFDKRRQGLHDMLAGTYVLEKPRKDSYSSSSRDYDEEDDYDDYDRRRGRDRRDRDRDY